MAERNSKPPQRRNPSGFRLAWSIVTRGLFDARNKLRSIRSFGERKAEVCAVAAVSQIMRVFPKSGLRLSVVQLVRPDQSVSEQIIDFSGKFGALISGFVSFDMLERRSDSVLLLLPSRCWPRSVHLHSHSSREAQRRYLAQRCRKSAGSP